MPLAAQAGAPEIGIAAREESRVLPCVGSDVGAKPVQIADAQFCSRGL